MLFDLVQCLCRIDLYRKEIAVKCSQYRPVMDNTGQLWTIVTVKELACREFEPIPFNQSSYSFEIGIYVIIHFITGRPSLS